MGTVLTIGKYLARQAKQIKLFGEKAVERQGVTQEILDTITPFRRLSNKKGTLSDPTYFIKQFEKDTGERFLPANWSSMPEADKVDYIVKDRYQKLVSHKIMSKIKDKPEEHLFKLNKDGNIVHYSKGDEGFCGSAKEIGGDVSIHNHPGYKKTSYDKPELEYIEKHFPEKLEGVTPFSDSDILTSISKGEKTAYVIDSNGHKFLFKPRQDIKAQCKSEKEYTKKTIMEHLYLREDLNNLSDKAFPSRKVYNAGIRTVNDLLMDLVKYEKKQEKYGKLLFPDFIKNKKLDKYLRAKTDVLSMMNKANDKINKGLKEISEKYGHYYEQLS